MSKITAISQELLTISAAPAGSQEENNALQYVIVNNFGLWSGTLLCHFSYKLTLDTAHASGFANYNGIHVQLKAMALSVKAFYHRDLYNLPYP